MKRLILAGLLIGLLAITAVSLAQPSALNISWWTGDGGGGDASGGDYAVRGTIGQFDAHTGSSGGAYVVRGGFWQAGVGDGEYLVFLPIVPK